MGITESGAGRSSLRRLLYVLILVNAGDHYLESLSVAQNSSNASTVPADSKENC